MWIGSWNNSYIIKEKKRIKNQKKKHLYISNSIDEIFTLDIEIFN